MTYKKIDPSEGLGNIPVPMSIELSFATSAKLDDQPVLEQVLSAAIADVQKRFEKDSFKVYLREGVVRPMSQEELLSLIPRKVHMTADGQDSPGWLCNTAHVAAKNITTDSSEVTCKLCLKAMGHPKPTTSGSRGR